MNAARAFLVGKLPAHGDFVARGLDPTTRAALDDWLAATLADAHAAWGDAFDARYDSAPAWRFGRSDEGGWWAGAIAPSVDAVGRRFPLLVGARAADEASVAALAARCEDAIYAAFAQGLDADALHAGLLVLLDDQPPSLPGWWTIGNGGYAGAVLAGDRPAELLRVMLGARGETA